MAIRHVSGHRLVAMIEIVSPANKDRAENIRLLVDKVVEALSAGVHVMLIDLFPPGQHDPQGIHAAIWSRLDPTPLDLPIDAPLTVASYLASWSPEVWLEHRAVSQELPEMFLFLTPDVCVPVPLAATYQAAFAAAPEFWQRVLEGSQTTEADESS